MIGLLTDVNNANTNPVMNSRVPYFRNYQANRRTHIRNLVLLKTDSRCWYCGIGIDGPKNWSIDRIDPTIRGYDISSLPNLAPACRSCNAQKHDKTLEEFRAYLARRAAGMPSGFTPIHVQWLAGLGLDLTATLPTHIFWFERG